MYFARWTDDPKLWLAVQPQGKPVNQGLTLSLKATPASRYDNVSYQWKRNGAAVRDGPAGAAVGGGIVSGAAGALTSPSDGADVVLRIEGVQVSDAGEYTVEFSNACNTTTGWAAAVTVNTCPGDLNADGLVDDSDFNLFAESYNTLLCDDPAMPTGCLSDWNGDGVVDDHDFQVFVVAYGGMVCGSCRYDSGMPHPVLVSSWNGVPALDCTAAMLARNAAQSADPLDALVAGIQLVEDDPQELSVGYGGLPNEDGEVELDAIVMHGPLHRSAAVAGVRRVRHVARLALEVLRRTDHSLIVGEGANKFARALGFPEENLLTEKSRQAWLDWKASLSTRDAWLSAAELAGEKEAHGGDASRSGFGQALWAGNVDPSANQAVPSHPSHLTPSRSPQPNDSRTPSAVPHTYGTIHTSLLLAPGSDLYGCTSTSGLSYKLAGRVGDTACVGAGCYTDNAVGSAGATGRGEAVMQSCGAFAIVDAMAAGLSPTDACLKVLKRIADNTKEKRLLDAKGRPGFNVTLYAVRKDGQYGSASMHEGYEFAVHSEGKTRIERAAFLFAK